MTGSPLRHLATALLLAVGAINLLPGVVAIEPGATMRLYGIALAGDDLVMLMRHRAVLLAVVGALLVLAAFRPSLRLTAIAVALASKSAFLLLYALAPALQPAIARVALIDAVAIAALLAVVALDPATRRVLASPS